MCRLAVPDEIDTVNDVSRSMLLDLDAGRLLDLDARETLQQRRLILDVGDIRVYATGAPSQKRPLYHALYSPVNVEFHVVAPAALSLQMRLY